MLNAKENVENDINKLINKIIRDSVKPLLYKKHTKNDIKKLYTENDISIDKLFRSLSIEDYKTINCFNQNEFKSHSIKKSVRLQNFQNIITKKHSNNNWIYAKLYQLLSKIQIGNIKKLVKIIDKLSECEYCAHQHQQHKEYCSNMFLFLNNEKKKNPKLSTLQRRLYLLRSYALWLLNYERLIYKPTIEKIDNIFSNVPKKGKYIYYNGI